MMTDVPTLTARDTTSGALTREMLAALDSDALTRFLLARRWFGAKGGRPSAARFREVVPLPWDGGRMALTTVEVTVGDDRVERYQLPLARLAASAVDGSPPSRAVLARVDGGGVIVDAVDDPRFLELLAEALGRGERIDGGEVRWLFEPLGDAGEKLRGQRPKVGSAEQSNTSIIYGDRAILKLFRRLEVGENPDVEIGRFLTTRTNFRGTPSLLGTIRLDGGSGSSVSAILQEFVRGSRDAWGYALDSARQCFGAPEDTEPTTAFADEARALGRVTRALHDALASDATDPEFAPQPATATEVGAWAAAAKRSIDEGLALLESRMSGAALGDEATAAARVLVRRRNEFPRLVDEIEAEVRNDAGARIRHHGDYHLGQVLRTPDGAFMIIDFEGEPARPLTERRARNCPLRDVAGMLRSFAYAAATAASEASVGVPRGVVEIRAGRWQRDVRKAFRSGYLSAESAGAARFLPAQRQSIAALTTLFEIEKVFYELKYELNNRPDWVWIPLRGIARLTEAGAMGDA
jgi:maltose alpha-D-glucosyltransferase/alpha-amylase